MEELYRAVFTKYPDIMNVKEVGEALGVSPKIVYRLLNNGTIVSLKTGREFRIPKVNLMKYVKIFDSQIYEQQTT